MTLLGWLRLRLTNGARRDDAKRNAPDDVKRDAPFDAATDDDAFDEDAAGVVGQVDDEDDGEVDSQADAEEEEEDDDGLDPFNPFPEPVRLEITDVFDLHTIPPREVKRVVEAYLEEAHRAGFHSVRIIHGKGRGVQRQLVRAVLARTPFILAFTDAPPQAGGHGATIAHLSTAHGKPRP